jgi:hypothetical protein
VEGAVKKNYLVGEEQIKRPAFETKKKTRAKTANPAPMSTRNNNSTTPPDNGSTTSTNPPPSERGGPSDAAREQIGDIRVARPIDFFNTQLTREFIANVAVPCTNMRATAEGAGAGGTVYDDFVPFNTGEMYKMIGLLFANGLSPKPQVEMWFLSSLESRLFGNDFIASALDKKLNGKVTIKGM